MLYFNKNFTFWIIIEDHWLLRNELQRRVIFSLQKPTPPWVLKIRKLFVDFINHKIRTQVFYYRFQNFVIFSIQNRQKTFFELILRVSRKSLLLCGFFSNKFKTYINRNEFAEICYYRNLNFDVFSLQKLFF
jgi:hypothetical protein